MRYWIAEAAKAARKEGERGQVHVAATIGVHQSTIWRFEEHKSFPEDIDLTIAAYADDLDCEPLAIWELATKMWREAGSQASVADLTARRAASLADPPEVLGLSEPAAAQTSRRAPKRKAGRGRSSPKRPA